MAVQRNQVRGRTGLCLDRELTATRRRMIPANDASRQPRTGRFERGPVAGGVRWHRDGGTGGSDD
ncbi:MAG: hypothetical protein AAGE01_20225 [Pseudomonadota bacterium]